MGLKFNFYTPKFTYEHLKHQVSGAQCHRRGKVPAVMESEVLKTVRTWH